MLLQPQHLQQSERHSDHARHLLLRTTTPCVWGFAELEIDTAALTLGKLALVRAVGVFGDGTVFDMPIDILSTMRDESVVLALPLRRAGALHTRLLRAGDATDAWTTLDIARVVEMDESITQFILDVVGQLVKYAHGPVVPMAVQWPGPKGSNQVRVQISPPSAAGSSGQSVDGPWALFKMLEKAQLEPGDVPERFFVTFNVENRRARFEVTTHNVQHPIRLRELRDFSCLEGL